MQLLTPWKYEVGNVIEHNTKLYRVLKHTETDCAPYGNAPAYALLDLQKCQIHTSNKYSCEMLTSFRSKSDDAQTTSKQLYSVVVNDELVHENMRRVLLEDAIKQVVQLSAKYTIYLHQAIESGNRELKDKCIKARDSIRIVEDL